jgi:hypothetical protein
MESCARTRRNPNSAGRRSNGMPLTPYSAIFYQQVLSIQEFAETGTDTASITTTESIF